MAMIIPPECQILYKKDIPEIPGRCERAARTSHMTQDKTTEDSADRFVRARIKQGHESILEFGDITAEFVCSRKACYDEKTEVLCETGWKYWKDVGPFDKLATLNADTQEIEYEYPIALTRYKYSGQMYLLKSQGVSICVTPNHRLYVKKYTFKQKKEKYDFYIPNQVEGKRVEYLKNGNWHGEKIEEFSFESRTDNGREYQTRIPAIPFGKIVGFWIGDGSLGHGKEGGYRVIFSCHKARKREYITRVLEEAGLHAYIGNSKEICTSCFPLYEWLEKNIERGYQHKRIPRDLLNYDTGFLKGLLEGLIESDGTRWEGHEKYYTSNEKLADDVQELALKCGISATIRKVEPRENHSITLRDGTKAVISSKESFVVSLNTQKNSPLVNHGKKHDKWITYNDFVSCAQTKNGILYIRRDGLPCWCGNSHQLVRNRLFSFCQESTRQVEQAPFQLILPRSSKIPSGLIMTSGLIADEEAAFQAEGLLHAEKAYIRGREKGISKQDLSYLTPSALATMIVAKTNVREWRLFFKQRALNPHAEEEIRYLAANILLELLDIVPCLFEDIVSEAALGELNKVTKGGWYRKPIEVMEPGERG